MGCIATKERLGIDPTTRKGAPRLLTQFDKELAIKAALIEGIKRRDSILFEKTIQHYEIRPLEVVGPTAQQKTLLHYVAEHNFDEGMALSLEYISQFHSDEAIKILNCKDAKGNTPLIACCLANSFEALEILMKYGQFLDHTVKNQAGKTALDIAVENGSPCLNLLQTGTPNNKSPVKSSTTASSRRSSQKIRKDDENLSPKSSRRGSMILKSVTNLTKDKSNVKPTTKLLQMLKTLGEEENFVDEEFPHDVCSMVDQESLGELMDRYDILKWERPTRFMKTDLSEIKIFEAIELNDVSESPIAWCDLYSALAAMAEYPQRLLKIFTTKEVNNQGVYSVNFLVSGINLEILLDDYFPCIQNSQLLFSRPQNYELWFLLLEKAFAKLYGNYSEIKSVMVAEAFETMTGMPSSQHALREAKEDDLWNTLLESDQRNHIICVGSYQKFANKNKVFMVGGVYEIDQKRVVKIKNHYDSIEWNGEFANGSDKWTKELKEELGHYEGEQANFYMDIKEFTKTFDFYSICHYNDKWIRNGIFVEAEPNKSTFFEFTIDKEMEVFISVHQRLPIFMSQAEDYEISPVEIILAEETIHDGIRGIAFGEKDGLLGKPTVYATDKIKLKLSEGKYILRVKVKWVDERAHEFTLNTFSQLPIELKKVEKEKYPQFLKQVYREAAETSLETFDLKNNCKFGSGWAGPHFWLYAANNGNTTWKIEITFEKMTNLKLCKTYKKNDNTLELIVPPKEKVIAYAKRLNGNPVEMRWRFQQEWK